MLLAGRVLPYWISLDIDSAPEFGWSQIVDPPPLADEQSSYLIAIPLAVVPFKSLSWADFGSWYREETLYQPYLVARSACWPSWPCMTAQ